MFTAHKKKTTFFAGRPRNFSAETSDSSQTTTATATTAPSADRTEWNVEEIYEWAKNKVGHVHAQKLKDQEYNGNALMSLSREELLTDLRELKIPLGAARNLLTFLDEGQASCTFFAWLLCFILGIKLTNTISSLSDKGALFV